MDAVSTGLAVLAGIVTVLLALIVATEVIMRTVFRGSLPWTLDVSTYWAMPTLVSLALGYALLVGDHIRVGLITDRATPTSQRLLELFGMALLAITLGPIIYFSTLKAASAFIIVETAAAPLRIPVWPFRIVLVVGLMGFLAQTVAQFVRAMTNRNFRFENDEVAALIDDDREIEERRDSN